MNSATHLFQEFDSIEFNISQEVAVTNRIETKFILSENDLLSLIRDLKTHYSLVTFDKEFIMRYSTWYYDTPEFDFYLAHHNKRMHRYKVRERTYQKNMKTFLELKYQSGANRVMKERVRRVQTSHTLQKNELDFLEQQLNIQPESLIPTVLNSYNRITLLGKSKRERVTIDLDLNFSIHNTEHTLEKLVVIEVKQHQREESPVFKILQKSGFRSTSLSKYCLGINYLYPELKKNNFKSRLNAINQIIHHGSKLNTTV